MNELDFEEKKPNIITRFFKSFDPIEKKIRRNEKAKRQLDIDVANKELDEEYLAILNERKQVRTTK
jgi:hypothetical protein